MLIYTLLLRHFYYDSVLDASQWDPPLVLLVFGDDLPVAATYSQDQVGPSPTLT